MTTYNLEIDEMYLSFITAFNSESGLDVKPNQKGVIPNLIKTIAIIMHSIKLNATETVKSALYLETLSFEDLKSLANQLNLLPISYSFATGKAVVCVDEGAVGGLIDNLQLSLEGNGSSLSIQSATEYIDYLVLVPQTVVILDETTIRFYFETLPATAKFGVLEIYQANEDVFDGFYDVDEIVQAKVGYFVVATTRKSVDLMSKVLSSFVLRSFAVVVDVVATTVGTDGNVVDNLSVLSDSQWVKDTGFCVLTGGIDEETEEELRKRVIDRIYSPANSSSVEGIIRRLKEQFPFASYKVIFDKLNVVYNGNITNVVLPTDEDNISNTLLLVKDALLEMVGFFVSPDTINVIKATTPSFVFEFFDIVPNTDAIKDTVKETLNQVILQTKVGQGIARNLIDEVKYYQDLKFTGQVVVYKNGVAVADASLEPTEYMSLKNTVINFKD